MSKQSEKVLAEAIETKGAVDTLTNVLASVRAELDQVKNQDDPHLTEAIAILDTVQEKAAEVIGFEPSQN